MNRDRGSRGRRRPAFGDDFEPPFEPAPMVRRSPPPPVSSGPPADATLKWFNAEKGFGFVAMSDGSPDAFLHVSAIERAGHRELPDGTSLTVRITPGAKGPQVAEIVSVDLSTASAAPRAERPERRSFGGGGSGGGASGPSEQVRGVVKWFKMDKGFGFIASDNGGKDVFVHASALKRSGLASLQEGEIVEMEVVQGAKGPEARSIRLVD